MSEAEPKPEAALTDKRLIALLALKHLGEWEDKKEETK